MSELADLLADYDRAVTQAEQWNVLTAIGAVATPVEVFQMFSGSDVSGLLVPSNGVWKKWLDEQKFWLHCLGKATAEPFVGTQITPDKIFYSGSTGPVEKKTLVVAVTGHLNRMMLPLHTFLQAFDAQKVDVLMYRSRCMIPSSVDEVDDSVGFTSWLSDLAVEIETRPGYRGHSIMGSSFGALPALIAGVALEFDQVLAVGPGSPFDRWWINLDGFDSVEFLQAQDPKLLPEITIALGADIQIDMIHAREIAELVPVKIIKVTDINGQKVMHPCLHPLVRGGMFPRFLAQTLDV
jgi:hypothetical protein